MERRLFGIVCAALLCGCVRPPSPCSGLAYRESGLTREQYAPCAKAMVGQLDAAYAELQIVIDPNRPKAERMRTRQGCLAASTSLARLMKEAGGYTKLVGMGWDDRRLTQFNSDVDGARHVYAMYCYYGRNDLPFSGMDSGHAAARQFAAELR